LATMCYNEVVYMEILACAETAQAKRSLNGDKPLIMLNMSASTGGGQRP
jgi:hypothetical protein